MSTEKIAEELRAAGIEVCANTVAKLPSALFEIAHGGDLSFSQKADQVLGVLATAELCYTI